MSQVRTPEPPPVDIVAISVGVVVGFIVIVIVGWFIWRRRRHAPKAEVAHAAGAEYGEFPKTASDNYQSSMFAHLS